jgi:uncharacterized membrane protein
LGVASNDAVNVPPAENEVFCQALEPVRQSPATSPLVGAVLGVLVGVLVDPVLGVLVGALVAVALGTTTGVLVGVAGAAKEAYRP